MKFINFVLRQKELLQLFHLGKDVDLKESSVEIRYFNFDSGYNFESGSVKADYSSNDVAINENRHFSYPVFFPKGCKKTSNVILMLHGLNERNWDKYLCWAEYLAKNTGKPVMLFPIAFHINRAPMQWSDPRTMSVLVKKRQIEVGENRSLCFANVALSERLTENPARFYTSGRQTIYDLTDLARQIKRGEHPLFASDTTIDFFAYSIGAFLSEIALMVNPEKLFDDSKLFIFCGGSIFRYMFGESRCIMDKPAYERLLNFYCTEWLSSQRTMDYSEKQKSDLTLNAFNAMIAPEIYKEKREGFFASLGNRLAGISLKKDTVMPYSGVEACMGQDTATKRFSLVDFPFDYTHESPFPTSGRILPELLNISFNSIFSKAAQFLR